MIALLAATGLASCDQGGAAPTGDAEPAPASGSARAEVPEADLAPAAPPSTATPSTAAPAGEAIDGAPAFAVVYPGGVVETTPLTTAAAGGAGGGIVFTAGASPDAIIDFYRVRAEAAGMTQIMSMNSGDTRGYGANTSGGASLMVVAHPLESGQTSTQVTWTAGQ